MTGRAHLLVLLVTAGAVALVLRLVRRRQLRAKYAILWLATSALLLPLAASPRILDAFARAVGIDYGPAAFFLAAIAFLFGLAVHFSWELSRLEERTRTLAEEVALLRLERAADGAPVHVEHHVEGE